MSGSPDVHSLPIFTLFRGSTNVAENFIVHRLEGEDGDGSPRAAPLGPPLGQERRTDLCKPIRPLQATTTGSSSTATSELLQPAKPSLTACLRGRTLLGTQVVLPTGYEGVVVLLGSASAAAQERIASVHMGSTSPMTSLPLGGKRPRDLAFGGEGVDEDLSDSFFNAAASNKTATSTSAPSKPASQVVGVHHPSIPGVVFDRESIPHSAESSREFPVTSANTSRHSVDALVRAAKDRILLLPEPTLVEATDGQSSNNAPQHESVYHRFGTFVVWEHDYPPTFADTKGPMLWVQLAAEIHASD